MFCYPGCRLRPRERMQVNQVNVEVNVADDSLRVLLVDDEESYLQTAAKVFRRCGFDVELCVTGQDAVDLLRRRTCQVVVLDLKMPGMNGQEVLGKIREHHPAVQVIILTGHASADDAAACLTRGAFDFLVKPVDMSHLMERVRTAYEIWKLSPAR